MTLYKLVGFTVLKKFTAFKVLLWGKAVRAEAGMSLIEMALVLAIMAIFTTFAISSFGNADENRDATVVQNTQARLQNTINMAAERFDIAPGAVNAANVINALAATPNVTLALNGANGYRVTLTNSGRTGTYRLNACGDICLAAATNFTAYTLSAATNSACATDRTPCQTLQKL
jgi:prepilin-type N-terminal cleavage/methylation domain-containing protein